MLVCALRLFTVPEGSSVVSFSDGLVEGPCRQAAGTAIAEHRGQQSQVGGPQRS